MPYYTDIHVHCKLTRDNDSHYAGDEKENLRNKRGGEEKSKKDNKN